MTDSNVEYRPEYLEALHKSIDKSKPKHREVETASPKVRQKRVKNELYIQENLDVMEGLSFYERLIFVRENLFEKNVRGDKPSKVRNTDLDMMSSYPEAPFPEAAYPYFVKLVDTLDSLLNSFKSEEARIQVQNLYKSYLETGSYSAENIPNIFTKAIFVEAQKAFKETEEDMKIKLGVMS